MTAQELADRIDAAWTAHLLRGQQVPAKHATVYASQWRACDRRMVLDLVEGDKLPPWDAETLARFERGRDRERDLLATLTRVGRDAEPPFQVIGQQERFELKDRKGRIAITGKVDARLEVNGARAPLECKAWHPNLVAKIEQYSDLFNNPWTRSGGYQLLAYLYGAGEPMGFLLLDRSGLPRLLPVELDVHLDRVEEFLTRAEQALDHRDAGTLPACITDAAECGRCSWYGAVCQPPTRSEGAVVLTDPELEAALERRHELDTATTEYDALDKQIKARLRGVESGICGHFAISGKWGKKTSVELPADIKAQYTVTDPKGKFTLEIARLGEQASQSEAA